MPVARSSGRLTRCAAALALAAPLAAQLHPLGAQVRPLNAGRSTSDIAAAATPATVTIYALSATGDTIGLGSGFFVRGTGELLTNWHVMRGASRALIVRPSGERFDRVAFVNGDSTLDLALLKVPARDLPFLPLRPSTPLVGEKVVTIGSPLGLSVTVSEGIVSATRTIDGQELVQITAPISPGSSGGAVLDELGRVFALSTLFLRGGQQLNFAVPVRYAMRFLEGAQAEASLASAFNSRSGGAADSRQALPDPRRFAPSPETRQLTPFATAPRTAPPPAAPAATPATPGGASTSAPADRFAGLTQRGEWPPLDSPPATARPVERLEGVWDVQHETWYDARGMRVRREGMLVANGAVGWLVLGKPSTTPSDRSWGTLSVYPVNSVRARPTGEVVLDGPAEVCEGYQSTLGFVIASTGRDDRGDHYERKVVATRLALSPQINSGLYQLAATANRVSAGPSDAAALTWDGRGAVVVANDSIYIDLELHDARGNASAFWNTGPLQNGSFALKTRNGSTLAGSIRSGVFTATWRDEREGGAIEGTIRGERR